MFAIMMCLMLLICTLKGGVRLLGEYRSMTSTHLYVSSCALP